MLRNKQVPLHKKQGRQTMRHQEPSHNFKRLKILLQQRMSSNERSNCLKSKTTRLKCRKISPQGHSRSFTQNLSSNNSNNMLITVSKLLCELKTSCNALKTKSTSRKGRSKRHRDVRRLNYKINSASEIIRTHRVCVLHSKAPNSVECRWNLRCTEK